MTKGFVNCHIYGSDATCFVVDGNVFSYVGDDEGVMTSCDEVIDLQGQYVYPGFNDTHMHLVNLGFALSILPLGQCRNLGEMKEDILGRVDGRKWVIGRGFNEDKLEDQRIFTKAELDEICPDTPVCLTRCCGHKMVANSKALEMADIDENTLVSGGKIRFEEGVLEESAIELIQAAWPIPSVDDICEYIRLGMKECNRYGITSVGSDDLLTITQEYDEALAAFEKMSYQKQLTVRVNEQCQFADIEEYQRFLHEGYTTEVGDEYFKIGPLKLLMDGSLGARTAYMSRPYNDDENTSGYPIFSKKELEAYVKLGAYYNMPSVIHVIGDKALDMVLDVYDEVVLEGNPLHHGLVHVQITREEQVKHIIEKKYQCYVQSIFTDYDSMIVKDRVGEDRAETSYAFRTYYENTGMSNGSDSPVEAPDVFKGLACAITHRSMSHPECGFNEKEAMSFEQAMNSFTINGAKASFEDDIKGTIEVNKLADFVIVKEDLSKLTPEQLCQAEVEYTYMDGEVVYVNPHPSYN